MKVKVSAIHFSADQKLINFVSERVSKLETFYDKIIASEATLKIEESSGRENKLVEIKLSIPGKELFAKKNAKSFEEATDNVVEALRRQIRKHKTKDLAAV
jgi:putative sigma-54 modulation protein